MKIVKTILIVVGVLLLFKAVLDEDFDNLFIAMFILAIGIGLEII